MCHQSAAQGKHLLPLHMGHDIAGGLIKIFGCILIIKVTIDSLSLSFAYIYVYIVKISVLSYRVCSVSHVC